MDVNITQYNNISKKLKEIVKEAMPKRGQTFYFRSLRPNSRGTSVLSIDTIFDPWAVDLGNGDFEGREVVIAYTSGIQSPSKLGERPTPILGRIQFRRSDGNAIPIVGGNVAHELLFQYLFLTNQNTLNRGNSVERKGPAEWYVPNSKGPAFTMDLPKRKAKDTVEFERKYRMAGDIIDEMATGELEEFAMGLEIPGYSKFTDDDEYRAAFLAIAKKDPGKIISLHKNENVQMNIFVKNAEKKGIVSYNDSLSQWEWPDTGDKVCFVPPGIKKYDAIVNFLLSEKGEKVRSFIKTQLDDKKEPAKPGRPKGSKNKKEPEAV